MKRLLIWLSILLLGAVLVTFIVANRHPVSLWPLPDNIQVPLYLVFFLGIFSGIGLAALFAAIRSVQTSLRDARHRRELANLETQVQDLEAELDARRPEDEDGGEASDQGAPDIRTLAKP